MNQLANSAGMNKYPATSQRRDVSGRRITQGELDEMIANHKKWLACGGSRCKPEYSTGAIFLIGANLSGLDFRRADLKLATLRDCDLTNCNFVCVSFAQADLSGSDLTGSNLFDWFIGGACVDGARFDGEELKECSASKLIKYIGREYVVPDWAKFIATDEDGDIFVFEMMPEHYEEIGFVGFWDDRKIRPKGRQQLVGNNWVDWRKTLVKI